MDTGVNTRRVAQIVSNQLIYWLVYQAVLVRYGAYISVEGFKYHSMVIGVFLIQLVSNTIPFGIEI